MTDQTSSEVQNIKDTAVSATEVERLLHTSERLLKNQQRRLVQERAAFETARTVVLNDYNAKVAQLEQNVREELTLMKRDHDIKVHDIERLIAKLTALREA